MELIAMDEPNGCRHCGVVERDHAQRWHPVAGWHGWTVPDNPQRLERMRQRRESRIHCDGSGQ